jgi:integrase
VWKWLQSGRSRNPLLEERNRRTGFFELDQLSALVPRLPEPLRPVILFAYITGWRIPSEALPLEWHQVDLDAGEIRLAPETTKNREGRVFPMTDDMRALLKSQQSKREEMKKAGHVVPWVFFRLVAKGRGGVKSPEADQGVHEGMEGRVPGGWLPRPHSARLAPNSREEHGSPYRPRARRDAIRRAQDAVGLRPLQHRLGER